MKYFFQPMAVIAFCWFFIASATQGAADSPLSLSAALSATLTQNPQLVGYRFRHQALAGEAKTAALSPALTLTTELENMLGSGDYRGVNQADMTLSLASVIELGDQRHARRALVTARQQLLAWQQRLNTLDVLAAMTQRFIAVAALQQQQSVERAALAVMEQNLLPLKRQVEAGRLQEAELLRARAAVILAQIELQASAQALIAERIKLSAFWGAAEPTFSHVSADIFTLPATLPNAVLLALLDKNPDLELLARDTQVRAAELQQAQASGAGKLDWSAGVRRLQASDEAALVMAVSMPLGSGSRASGAQTTARAQLDGAQWAEESAYKSLQAQLLALAARQRQAVDEARQLRTQVLPLLTQAMQATQAAFNKGRYSYLELSLAERELLSARMGLIAAAARAQTLQIEIERMTAVADATAQIATPPVAAAKVAAAKASAAKASAAKIATPQITSSKKVQ
jgi:outer membrane protein, heavy metal efflux system